MVHFHDSDDLHWEELRDEELFKFAEQRARRGLASPDQIYRVENRRRIYWSRFPAWARPVDPEIFDGSCHEG